MHDFLDKQSLRKRYLERRKSLGPDMVREGALGLRKSLEGFDFSPYRHVMLYMSHDNEIPVSGLQDLFQAGTCFYVPCITPGKVLVPAMTTCNTSFCRGGFGIRVPEIIEEGDTDAIDLVFVPGIVFDRLGNRIGYGKGYYDKFLAGIHPVKVGCCYSFQLLDLLPGIHPHDVRMDYILTEDSLRKPR
ncbi:MAG: 5-formyltetrahydrofolate cyclo-ligase [Clostridia bacterium]